MEADEYVHIDVYVYIQAHTCTRAHAVFVRPVIQLVLLPWKTQPARQFSPFCRKTLWDGPEGWFPAF